MKVSVIYSLMPRFVASFSVTCNSWEFPQNLFICLLFAMCKGYVKTYFHMLAKTDSWLFTMCKSYVKTYYHMLAKTDP